MLLSTHLTDLSVEACTDRLKCVMFMQSVSVPHDNLKPLRQSPWAETVVLEQWDLQGLKAIWLDYDVRSIGNKSSDTTPMMQ